MCESKAESLHRLDRRDQGVDIGIGHGSEADIEEGFGGDIDEEKQLEAKGGDPADFRLGGVFEGSVGAVRHQGAIEVALPIGGEQAPTTQLLEMASESLFEQGRIQLGQQIIEDIDAGAALRSIAQGKEALDKAVGQARA